MRKLNKKWLALSASLILPISILPIAAACSHDNKDVEERARQNKILNEQLAFNKVLITLTNSYLATFYQDDLTKNGLSFSSTNDVILELLTNKNENSSEFYKDAYEIFKIFAFKKLDSNPQYFSNLINTFIQAEIDTTSYQPAPYAMPNETEFKFLMQHSDKLSENIRYEIQSLILSRNYLLKDRKELRALANDETGKDKIESKVKIDKDKTPVKERIIHENLDLTENSLYLIKYLLNTPLVQSWSFDDNRDMNLRWRQGEIATLEEFNKLAEYNPANKPLYKVNEVAKRPELLIAIGENEHFDLTKLRAYRGISKSESYTGELSNDIFYLKEQLSPIFGFVSPTNNKVYSQDAFKFAKLIIQERTTPLAQIIEANKAELIKEDNKKEVAISDIEFKDLTKVVENNKTYYEKEVTLDDNQYHLRFEVVSVTSQLKKTKDIEIEVKVTVKELEKRQFLTYRTKLINLNPETESKEYNLNLLRTNVNSFNANTKSFSPKYIVKIVPLFTAKPQTTNSNDKETKETKSFSFRQTPWESNEQQKIIANNIIFMDQKEIFKQANKYYQELGFKIDDKAINETIAKKLKLEGLL
ncbi:HinT-interacting membrane complex lipoprotein P60 [[Mycoplasma] anseris]|uniref:P60-like lipoprotein n=1 Tax=[Mycoplasma] anseris TaxID=92400 RepID=A0A2Z4NDG9_9BACT|nr:hypothetical protein [[Mycoplasma] anseris]AWX69631.1 hypothetical protein DP065_02660 [[Mycoplasma] anseris]